MAVGTFRCLSLLLVTALAFVGTASAASAAPASAAAGGYVALGDSYSSGVGAGAYGDSGGCKRSANAYPRLFADANDITDFRFAACLGARTDDVLAQTSALSASTALVTVSVGGNDAGFTDVMIACTTSGDQGCVDRVEQAENYAETTLPGLLDEVYSTIRSKAPNAEVVVLGYPRFYEIGGSCRVGLSDIKRAAINSGADTLADVIGKQAAEAGFTFVDVRERFTGHEICSADWWLHSLTWPIDESYHPNADGQRLGYLPALEAVAG